MAKSKGFETAIGKGGETHERITPAFAVAQAMRTPGETTAETHVVKPAPLTPTRELLAKLGLPE